MVVCQHVLQGVSVVHVATAPARRPWRPWRTSSALRRDRDEQQLQRFGCQSCRCRAVHAAATQSQEATLRQQTDQDLNAQPDPRYEGVAWVDDQESQLADEARQEEQEPQLQRTQSAKPPQIKHIDEDQPVRHKFHRRMMQAAANGQASDVSEILEEMKEDGLEPGPYAYHALVFAHVKNKNSDEALAVMQLMHKLGLQAVAQSYCAVIHSFVSDSQLDLAMRVFASMQASGISAHPGWLTITNQLYAAGQHDLADKLLLNRQPDWQPDSDLYVHIIKSACSAIARSADPAPSAESSETDVDQFVEALKILEEMKARGVTPGLRHMHPILEGYSKIGASSSAETFVRNMGRDIAPDVRSFELIARAHIQSGKDGVAESLTNVSSDISKAGLQTSKRFLMLMVEANLLENNLEEALGQFRSLRIAGRIRGVMRLLPDNVLYSLLQKLSSANMPAELLRMLSAMHVDGRRMPAVDESTTDNAASSLLTSWLAGTRSTASQKFEGVMAQPKDAVDEITQVDGVSILGGKYAVNAEGKILSPSSQKVPQLKAELTARNLSTEGNREELKRRVMAARNAEPPDMAKAIRKKEALREAKRNKLEKAMKQDAAATKAGETAPAGSIDDRKAKVQVVAYGVGKSTVKEEFEAVVDDEEEGITPDDEAVEDTTVDPMQASNTATAVEDDDYVVGDDDSPDVLMEDGNDTMDDQLPSRREGVAARKQTAVAVAARRPVSNADAGADVALQLLCICETLGGSATAGDYKQILQVCEAEGNAGVARNIVGSWHEVLQTAYDPATVSDMYHRAARVCISNNSRPLAQDICRDMQSREIGLDSQLQDLLEHHEQFDTSDSDEGD